MIICVTDYSENVKQLIKYFRKIVERKNLDMASCPGGGDVYQMQSKATLIVVSFLNLCTSYYKDFFRPDKA